MRFGPGKYHIRRVVPCSAAYCRSAAPADTLLRRSVPSALPRGLPQAKELPAAGNAVPKSLPIFQRNATLPRLAREYARARREGIVNGRPVRTRSIQADLRFLKSALAWGVTAERHGRPYVDRNRLAGWHLPREQDTRRPLILDETIRALTTVAPRVHPRLTLLILLGNHGASVVERLGVALG